jgi:hypothetical protein
MSVPNNPKLSDVIAEFLAPVGTRLSQFLRGGAYVPDVPQNAAVPSALPISLKQLVGAVRWIPHSATIVPNPSEKSGDRPVTLQEAFTCHPVNGTGPFTYAWSQATSGGPLIIESPSAQTTVMSKHYGSGGPSGATPTVDLVGTVFCLVTDMANGNTFTAEADVGWTFVGSDPVDPP